MKETATAATTTTTILREIHTPSPPPPPPSSSSNTHSTTTTMKLLRSPSRKHILSSKENTPPPTPPLKDSSSVSAGKKINSPLLPPRPPSRRNRDLLNDDAKPSSTHTPSAAADSGVQVIVRMRPPKNQQQQQDDDDDGDPIIVYKISTDSLSINGHNFSFDSVADIHSTQLDIFNLVGIPLVDNCLSGFNSSVFAYGQTGSGKTYTIWGPISALSLQHDNDQQGLTPRVFDRLFSRINQEQIKHVDKELKYQCRCSFLEIYNEQITDLLDPTLNHLQIREDVKSGVYVENLTEVCVSTRTDVTQLLLKGLSNKRTGATTINSESSRSHSVFTCVVESHCKITADGVSRFKTSKINLVDLAGSERQKLTGAAGDRLKEAGNINRSLSQLGNLINILAEVSQTGKQRHIPYRDSRLTFLLQDSLGGNAKLAMVCAISPSQSCKSETLSTLRFAQRAKAIKNKAVVNEVMQDDVHVLREVIRGLKDELVRMKANGNPTDSNGGYSTGWNARRSLNLLKFSLNRHMILPHTDDDDGDTEMEIDDERADKDSVPLQSHTVSSRDGTTGEPKPNPTRSESGNEKIREGIDVIMNEVSSEQADKHENTIRGRIVNDPNCSEADVGSSCILVDGDKKDEPCLIDAGKPIEETGLLIASGYQIPNVKLPSKRDGYNQTKNSADLSAVNSSSYSPPGLDNCPTSSNLSIVQCDVSIVKSPIRSVSPKVNNNTNSLITSTAMTESLSILKDEKKLEPDSIHPSLLNSIKTGTSYSLAIQKSKNFNAPTEYLAASLHRGLEIINGHRQSSAFRRSMFRSSLRPVDNKPMCVIDKVNVGVQTLLQENEISREDSVVYLCSNCNSGTSQPELNEVKEGSNLQLVPFDGSVSNDRIKKQVPKAVEKVLAGAIRREMAMEELCSKQTAEIMQLNRIVQQYRHERECNAMIGQTREDKIARLECLMDGVLPTDEFMGEEFISLKKEHKLLNEKYENHPEVLRTKVELERVQEELEMYRNFHEMGERDVLLEEIEDLRSQLHYYVDSSAICARKRSPPLQLTHSCKPSQPPPLCATQESNEENTADKFEQERLCWVDTESKWISLVEELRRELEANRSLADKRGQELDCEKKCAEELKEAMQMAMEGHARMLEQYADLQENYIALLAKHRKIHEGIDDVKKAAVKAGVRGAESKFINALAAEVSALKLEQEKERRYFRDEIKGLQAQLRDTAEAVQAAGELLVRLKEAEEGVSAAQNRAVEAEEETEKAYIQIDRLKSKHDSEMKALHQRISKYCIPKEATQSEHKDSCTTKYDADESDSAAGDQEWREEFEPFYKGEFSKLAEPSSWFSGYDRCNI